MALRNIQSVQEVDSLVPGVCIDIGAFQGTLAESKRGACFECFQFFIKSRITEFGPGMDTSHASFVRHDQGTIPVEFCCMGIQLPFGDQ